MVIWFLRFIYSYKPVFFFDFSTLFVFYNIIRYYQYFNVKQQIVYFTALSNNNHLVLFSGDRLAQWVVSQFGAAEAVRFSAGVNL